MLHACFVWLVSVLSKQPVSMELAEKAYRQPHTHAMQIYTAHTHSHNDIFYLLLFNLICVTLPSWETTSYLPTTTPCFYGISFRPFRSKFISSSFHLFSSNPLSIERSSLASWKILICIKSNVKTMLFQYTAVSLFRSLK